MSQLYFKKIKIFNEKNVIKEIFNLFSFFNFNFQLLDSILLGIPYTREKRTFECIKEALYEGSLKITLKVILRYTHTQSINICTLFANFESGFHIQVSLKVKIPCGIFLWGQALSSLAFLEISALRTVNLGRLKYLETPFYRFILSVYTFVYTFPLFAFWFSTTLQFHHQCHREWQPQRENYLCKLSL